jgi:hypothetical protein
MLDFPQYVPAPESSRGPDPLGLQASVMNLYRKVFPGLNNRARYLRVYSALCWTVRQIWNTLDEASSDEDIQNAFTLALPKMQLLLVWGNSRWEVTGLPGSTRKWPGEGETGTLSYAQMPTGSASHADDDNEDLGGARDGTTLLAADEYGPSATNGLQFLSRWQGFDSVFELTPAGDELAEAFEALLAEQSPPKTKWLRDPYDLTIKAAGVDGLMPVLGVFHEPTKMEREYFAAQFFPDLTDSGIDADFSHRRSGLTLALRAIAAEERASGKQVSFIDVHQIRHTMARGMASDGATLELDDLRPTQRAWQSLQLRKYLKLALETLFRSCEARLHHAMAKSFQVNENGQRLQVSRSVEAISRMVGELAQASLTDGGAADIATLMHRLEAVKGDAPSLYCAGRTNRVIDIRENLAYLQRHAGFKLNDVNEDESLAVGSALLALLWCATESNYLPEESLAEDGDRLNLLELRSLTERFADASPSEFVAEIVSEYVINLHFDVVRERSEEDFANRRIVKDRYRILLGDDGLERNLTSAKNLTRAVAMSDILLHALYLLAQSGFLVTHPGKSGSFRLTAAGKQRAAQRLEVMDDVPVHENDLVLA